MFGIEDFSSPVIDFSSFEVSQLGEALVFGAAILFIGMLTVFAVLCILWLFLVIFKLVFHDLPKRKPKKETLTPVEVNESATRSNTLEEGELIAVLAAAVAMAESECPGSNFRVVSFRRT